MTSIPVAQAHAKRYELVDDAAESHEPVQITGKRASVVPVSDDDWPRIQENLYLLSVPGLLMKIAYTGRLIAGRMRKASSHPEIVRALAKPDPFNSP